MPKPRRRKEGEVYRIIGEMDPRTIGQQSDSMDANRDWRAVFNKIDADRRGKIPLRELRCLLLSKEIKPELHKDFTPEVIQQILEFADSNHDGQLCYEEFLHMMSYSSPEFHRLVHLAAYTVVSQSERVIRMKKYIEGYNCIRPPIFMVLISLVEIAVYIYYCIHMNELSGTGPIPIHSPFIYNPCRRYEAWRYLTYMLVHAGYMQIFTNLLIQLTLGIYLEIIHKWWRVMLIYFAGVIAGSFGSSLADPFAFLCGASGGVYALLAAHLANVIINFKEMPLLWIRIVLMLAVVSKDIEHFSENMLSKNMGFSAHIAGALAGLMVGIYCLRNLRVHKWENVIGWIFLMIYIILIVFAILWNVFYSDYFPKYYCYP